MKPFIVINPRAANGATGKHFDTISEAVRGAVGDHAHAFTERPFHAAQLTSEALRKGHDLIVAVGGDGTINEVVNGFFAADGAPIKPGAALAVLPRGTGGDFRRTLGLDQNLAKSALRLKNAPRPVDVGRVEFIGDDGKPASRYFMNVGEVGVGAKVVEIANKSSKVLGGKLTFMMASMRALVGWRDVQLRVSFDGGPAEDLDVTTLAICNGAYFGGGMKVAPEARLDDGLLHITIWSGFSLLDFVTKQGAIADGTHVRLAGTKTRTAKTVRVEARGGGAVGIECDGERLGSLPATFSLVPGALSLVS